MNQRQKNCMERLRKALDACHKEGLSGGVYDCLFYAWPSPKPGEYNVRDAQSDFFRKVEEIGGFMVHSDMSLDGGSGS